MFTKKKPFPGDDPNQKLTFAPMGQKPIKPQAKPDIENAADAKKPGDAKEDAQDAKTTKKPKSKGASFYAAKAATALSSKK